MTLTTPYSASFSVGDGETREFPFTFEEVNADFIKVLVYNVNGTVSVPTFTPDLDLKHVVFGDETPTPTADDVICIYRETPTIQDTPFRTLEGYNAKALENILSKIVAMIQEIKSTYFSTQVLQGDPWQLDLLTSADDGATVNIDYTAKKLVKGLYFQITNGNLQVSADGSSYITMPKSADIVEFRQVQTVLEDLTVQYRLQYRIGNEWFNAESNAEATADEAKQIAEEARDIASDAKDIAQDASDKVDGFDDRLTQAEQDASDAKDIAQDASDAVSAHITDTNNPHSVTKAQVGLDNVDNTSDLDKPISTATQTALDLKMPISTKYGAALSLTINSTTYVVTAQLKDQDGNNLGTAQTIDLPLESVVVSGAYDSVTKEVVLTLQDGSKIRFSVADLVSGLQTEITALNMLDADLVDDTTSTHKFVTTTEKSTWSSKQDAISDLTTIRSNAQAGKAASDTIATYGDIVTHNASEFASSTNRINGAPLSNTTSNFYGVSNTAAATVQKEVSIPSVTTLDIGTIIIVQPTVTSTVANSTLKLNDFPAYPMRYNDAAITTSTDSVVWSASFPSIWVFDGTYWVFAGHGLDSNTTYTLNYSVDAGQYTAGSGTYAVTRYSILAQKADGTWEKITATNANYSAGTSKSVNTSGFILNQLRYYGTTTAVAGGVKIATNVMYEKSASVDMRYSTNCGGTTTWALGDYIYLVGTIGADGLFYLDTTTWWSNALPTTNDGKLYIRLGLSLTAAGNTMSFFDDRPIFYHDGTGIKEYKVADNKQDVISDLATIRSGAGAGATAVQPGDLATVATTGDYDDLLNKPTIPAVNDATLTIQKNGTTVQTFTANQSTNATANISVPTKTSDITNDSGFITSSALAPYALSADLATVATSGDYDDLSNKPTIPTVGNGTITITQGGISKGTFTTNQSGNTTIALDAGGGGIGNIDNLTITANADQEIQTVATINANPATGATNPIYDWVGTLAEYNAQSIESLHPDWVCFITDDLSAEAYEAYTKGESLNLFVQKGHQVIEFQEPTAANNYTWYRKYADGWVEQGGYLTANTTGAVQAVALPIEMSDNNYQTLKILSRGAVTPNGFNWGYFSDKASTDPSNTSTTAYFSLPSTSYCLGAWWQVSGMAAN